MKTLTELSGTLIRTAAAAIAEARRSLPRDDARGATAAATNVPPAEGAGAGPEPAEAAPEAASAPAPEGAAPAPAGEAPAEAAAPAAPAKPTAPAKEAEEVESEAVKAALDAAVAKATGLSGDRLAMLRDAVKVAGRRTDDVRLVRVFGPEEPVPGAKTAGGHQYLVDVFPASMKQSAGGSREDRGRRGGRGGGGRSEGRGTKAGATGGFSMDSLREDRKNERGGGRPGFRKPGGGRPGGGRPGGGAPGGGAPKP